MTYYTCLHRFKFYTSLIFYYKTTKLTLQSLQKYFTQGFRVSQGSWEPQGSKDIWVLRFQYPNMQLYLKREMETAVFLRILRNFFEAFFAEHFHIKAFCFHMALLK